MMLKILQVILVLQENKLFLKRKKSKEFFSNEYKWGIKEITKKEYLSTEGEAFSRESVINIFYPGYIWGSNPRL